MLKMLQILCLLKSPFSHTCRCPGTIIVNSCRIVLFASGEKFDCRIASHPKTTSCFFVLSSIYLGYFNLSFQIGCQLCIFRSQAFTVPAPRCIELNKPRELISIDLVFEGVISQHNDIFFFKISTPT